MKTFQKKVPVTKNKEMRVEDLQKFRDNSAAVKQLMFIASKELLELHSPNKKLIQELENSVVFLDGMHFLFGRMIASIEK